MLKYLSAELSLGTVKIISKEIEFKDFPDLIMNMSAGKTDYPGKVIIKL